MQTSILIQLLSKLSTKEMTRFHELSLSPYFNKHKKVRALCGYLREIHPHFKEVNCERQLIFKKIFEATPFDQAQLDIVFAYTLKLLEHFFTQEQLKHEPNQQNRLLLHWLRERNEIKRYEKNLKKMQRTLTQAHIKDGDYYHSRYLLAAEADAYYMRQSKYEKADEIVQKQANLDKFYLAEKLKDACEMSLRRNILKMDATPDLMPEIIAHFKKNIPKYSDTPPVMVYYHLYELLSHEDAAFYYQLLPILAQYIHHFSIEEQRHIYAFAQNYCIAQINKGKGAFLAELFELYKVQLAADLLLENGYLSEWHYKNIVTVGLRIPAFDWVLFFLKNYRSKLHPSVVENAYTYNLANYYYTTQQYDKVQNLLAQVEYTDIRYSLDAKTLLLRTYYELDEYEAFESLAEAFRQYLKRNRLMSESRRQGYYSLLKFTRRAFRIKERQGYTSDTKIRQAITKLQAEIDAAQGVFNVNWLREKVGEL